MGRAVKDRQIKFYFRLHALIRVYTVCSGLSVQIVNMVVKMKWTLKFLGTNVRPMDRSTHGHPVGKHYIPPLSWSGV